MRAVIQRVSEAEVKVEGAATGGIGKGLLVLAGFEDADSDEDLIWMANKIIQLRIFNDESEMMNLSIMDIKGQLLLVSQFTLHAQSKKGNRPSFIRAAKPEVAIPLYEKFKVLLHELSGKKIETGIFGADMKVSLLNDGPVTIIIDSKNKDF
jgi:D-tyrosyl-tRNA(Tyr) deacylase